MTDCNFQDDVRRLHRFLDGMGVAVILAEPQTGKITFINKRCALLLGHPLEELCGRQSTFWDLVHPQDRAASAAEYARLMHGDISDYVMDTRYVRPSGDSPCFQVSVTLMRNEDGEPQACVVALGEMSERRMLEQQLAVAEQLAGMLTWSWDAKADLATTSGGALLGFAERPISSLSKTLLKIHPDDRDTVKATIARAVATGIGYAHEYRVINLNGEIRYMRGTATCLLDAAGAVTHLVGATIDVTDIKSRQDPEQAPKVIRDILKDVETNWNKPIYVEELARRHGISPRAIQRYFATRGMLPLTKHIKQIRLRHAHQALSNPKPRTSVTAVALACGFQNPGHFSRDYREEFGELPSETLRTAGQPAKAAPDGG